MMKMKCYCMLISFTFAFLLGSMAMRVMAQPPYYDATFTSIKVTDGTGLSDLLNGGTAKVYDGQTIWINESYHNGRCGLIGAYFYAKLYVNDDTGHFSLAWTGETYVLKGTNMGNQFSDYEYGAKNVNYTVELWWNSSGTNYLEDSRTFGIQIVKLNVKNWLAPMISVEKGKTTASTWSVSFTNGGNDMMFGASISVVDARGLQTSPSSANLGNIASQGAKSTSFSVVAPNALSTGSQTVSFQVSYSDFEGNSHVESQTGNVLVTKLGTSITSTLAPFNVKIGGSTTITARLLDDNGNPITSQSIVFSLGTTVLGSAFTDSSGNAVEPYVANVSAGTYAVNASYTENDAYLSSSATSNLIVSPFTTNVTIDAPSATQGNAATLKATLKDENGNPIQGMNVDFQIYDGASWTSIGSASTDSSGIASLSYTPSSTGSFQVKAVFGGTTNYASSSSSSANLNVGMDYTRYYIVGAIIVVVVLGAIGILVFRRRHKKIPPPK